MRSCVTNFILRFKTFTEEAQVSIAQHRSEWNRGLQPGQGVYCSCYLHSIWALFTFISLTSSARASQWVLHFRGQISALLLLNLLLLSMHDHVKWVVYSLICMSISDHPNLSCMLIKSQLGLFPDFCYASCTCYCNYNLIIVKAD